MSLVIFVHTVDADFDTVFHNFAALFARVMSRDDEFIMVSVSVLKWLARRVRTAKREAEFNIVSATDEVLFTGGWEGKEHITYP